MLAHRKGIKKAQSLFTKYMPPQCVELLKENGCWDKPYVYQKPVGCTVVEKPPQEGYSHIDKSFAIINEDVESECNLETNPEETEDGINMHNESYQDDNEETTVELNVETTEDPEVDDSCSGRNWKISKWVEGSMTYIHIKQGLKILLPREYISRCRQKRHWASQYLPGKEPLKPKHDIFKYCNVALRVVRNNKQIYDIGRVEVIESTKDGSEVISFEKKGKMSVRVRCSLYTEADNDVYFVANDVLLTTWKPPSALIGAVELEPISESPGKFKLHPESRARLQELGFCSRNAKQECCESSNIEFHEECFDNDTGDDDEFYEVEEVLSRRLSKDTLSYEYKVRFKGYGPEDDMWLPSSYFNRPVTFESTSKFGRKRKHTLDPEIDEETQIKRRKQTSSREKRERAPLAKTSKRTHRISKNKGKAYRSSLNCRVPQQDSRKCEEKDEDDAKSKRKKPLPRKTAKSDLISEIPRTSFEKELPYSTKPEPSEDEAIVQSSLSSPHRTENVITLSSDDNSGNDSFNSNESDYLTESIKKDLSRRDDNFLTPRSLLATAELPSVDGKIQDYNVKRLSEKNKLMIQDPLTVDRVPPISVLKLSMDELRKKMNENRMAKHEYITVFPGYGCFSQEGLRILSRYDKLRSISREVAEETQWMAMAFEGKSDMDRQMVTKALLDRWNTSGKYLVELKGYKLTSQDLSILCCERYLNDEVTNLLIVKYCDEANVRLGRDFFTMLPSYATSKFCASAVNHVCFSVDMSTVEIIFLPVHIHGCHWGLSIFDVKNRDVRFDDGYHCRITKEMQDNTRIIITSFHQATGLPCFDISS